MTIEIRNTERGFGRGEFKDRNGEACSIQKSSIATEDCIWLGQEKPTVDQHGMFCGCRMHLTQALAAELIPILQRFVDTGDIEAGPTYRAAEEEFSTNMDAAGLTAAHAIPLAGDANTYTAPGGEFLPPLSPLDAEIEAGLSPLEPGQTTIGAAARRIVEAARPDPVKVIQDQWRKVGSPELWAEVDALRKQNAALRAAPAHRLFELLKSGRDLIEEALYSHIYDVQHGDVVPADDPNAAHVAAVDKLLGDA